MDRHRLDLLAMSRTISALPGALQRYGEQTRGHHDLSHLEGDGSAVADGLRADLHQRVAQLSWSPGEAAKYGLTTQPGQSMPGVLAPTTSETTPPARSARPTACRARDTQTVQRRR